MSEKLISIVRDMYDAMPKLDWATYESHLHPDFRVVEADSLPFAGTYRGMAGLQELIGKVFGLFSEFIPDTGAMCANDNTVMVWVEMTMTGMKSGKTIHTQMIEVFHFDGDKLVEIKPFYYDTDLIASILD